MIETILPSSDAEISNQLSELFQRGINESKILLAPTGGGYEIGPQLRKSTEACLALFERNLAGIEDR